MPASLTQKYGFYRRFLKHNMLKSRNLVVMNKYIIIVLLAIFLFPLLTHAQKKEKKRDKKNKQSEIVIDNQEVTNLFIDATKTRLIGDKTKAINLYNSCLEKNPEHAASMYELAQLYFEKADYSTAARFAENAAAIEPDNKWYKLLLVEIYGKSNSVRELVDICKELVKIDPKSAEYQYELANAYLLANDGNNALKTFDRIEEIMGITEEISMQKQRILLIMKKPEQAAGEIEKLIVAFPDEKSKYLSVIAEMYMQLNKPDEAAVYYEKIKQSDPENPYIHISLSDYYTKKGETGKAFEEMKLGFLNPALDIDTKIRVLLTYFIDIQAFEKNKTQIFELASILVKVHPDDPKAHSMYGDLLLDSKQYEQARDEFRKVIAIDSSKYVVWESLLNAQLFLQDYTALMNESIRAIELFPLQPVPYLFKGSGELEKKKYAEALESFNTGVKLVSGNPALSGQFYTYLGDTYNQLKNYTKSDESYEKALKINPENSYVLNNYAYYLSLRGENLEKAMIMSEKAVKLAPENPANLDTYGWVLYKSGKYNEALIWVEKAIQFSKTTDPDLLEHLGDIYFKLNNIEKAVESWQKALDTKSGSSLLEKKIKDRKLYD